MLSQLTGRHTASPWLRVVAVLGTALVAGACSGDEVIDPPFRDAVKPRISLAKSNVAEDTLLSMGVNATDNIGIKTIRVLLSGGVTSQYDTTFTSATQAENIKLDFKVPTSARLGSTVIVRAVVLDGANNLSDTARLVLTVGNLEPPKAVITSPKSGTDVVSGKSLVLSLSAAARYKVTTLGYQISGAYSAARLGALLAHHCGTRCRSLIRSCFRTPSVVLP